MSGDGTVPIRSFRNCFKLERRIHKIDRWRLPVPFGVPLRGLGYALGAELVILLLSRLPLVGTPVLHINPALRLVVTPLAVAFVMATWEIDGRPAHAAFRSWISWSVRPRRLVAWRPASKPGTVTLGQVTIAPDDRGAQPRPAAIVGPARVLMRYPFTAHQRGRTLRVLPQAGPPQWRGKEIVLAAGQRMVIR